MWTIIHVSNVLRIVILHAQFQPSIFLTSHILQRIQLTPRAVASLTVPGGQEFHFPHFFLKFGSSFPTFPQTFLIFFPILALRVGKLPTREGPGYTTAYTAIRLKE